MNMVQVYIKGQEDKELSSFLRYYPVRIKNIGMDAFFDRQVVYISRMVETMQMWRSAWQRCLSRLLANVPQFMALRSRRMSEQSA